MSRQNSLVGWAVLALVILTVSHLFTLLLALACIALCVHAFGVELNAYSLVVGLRGLSIGMRPTPSEGFRRFVAAPQISKAIEQTIDHELREARTQPFDSNPPLRDRIAAASR